MISEDCEMTRLTFTGTTQSEFSSYSASLNTFIKANLTNTFSAFWLRLNENRQRRNNDGQKKQKKEEIINNVYNNMPF